MDLQFNYLTGSLPSQIRNLTFMQIMYLNNNRFKGSFPQELGMLASVQVVTFEHNFFSGNFPDQLLFNCTALNRISVHNNRLQGRIPSSIRHLAYFENFEAGNNMLTGPLPPGLSNCTNLRVLNLSNNLLTGEIQTSVVAGLVQFITFDLSINNLSGPIPSQFGNMIQLQTLDLSYNKLSGTVPSSLSGCVGLLSLNLSSNSLTGSIPDQLGRLKSLQQLDLSANSLSGTIPSTLAGIRTLVFLNLSYNSLEGTVPKGGVFSNLTSASFLGNPRLCGFPVNKSCAGNSSPHASSTKLEKIWLPVGTALLLLGIGCFLFAIFRRKKASLTKGNSWDFTSPFLRLTLEDIQQATNNFSEENILGTGVTGIVYKGMMADGRTLAFKRFMPGNPAISSFIAELQSVGSIRHRNLIRILGYCSDQQDTNILILEYMPNRSLNDHLHIIPQEGKCRLSWEDRHRVATAVAQGLLYLHYDCPAPVIHCDLKPQNILFDADMEVHITDFGLAKVMGDIATSNYTQNMQGTLGYMAPELASYGHISRKCDVYSYGILLMELVSGRKPTDELDGREGKTLVQWVRSMFEANQAAEIVDQRLHEEYNEHEAKVNKLLLSVALQCTQENPRERPTMQQVVQVLLSSSSTSPHAAS